MPELEALLSSLRADLATRQSSPDLSEDLERMRLQHAEETALGAQRLREATDRLEESEKKLADLQVSLIHSLHKSQLIRVAYNNLLLIMYDCFPLLPRPN